MIPKQIAILDKLHQLPVMPMVVKEVMGSLRDPNAGAAIMAHKISTDQGLSARVLRMANSSFYGLAREVGSIQDAVTVLGFDTVRSLVVSAGFAQAFPVTGNGAFNRSEYWMRSFRVANYTEALAQALGLVRQMAFTAGMFYDVGQLVLSICIPQQFADILKQQQESESSLIEIERTVLGYDHATVGAEMARRWNFPHEIEHAIHYWRKAESEEYMPATALVHIAVLIESGVTGDQLVTQVPLSLCERLKLRWEQLAPYMPDPEQLEATGRLMLEP